MNISNSSVTNLSDDKNLIRWDPKFSLGIPLIDEQHKHLVELCNKLYTEVMASRLVMSNIQNIKTDMMNLQKKFWKLQKVLIQ